MVDRPPYRTQTWKSSHRDRLWKFNYRKCNWQLQAMFLGIGCDPRFPFTKLFGGGKGHRLELLKDVGESLGIQEHLGISDVEVKVAAPALQTFSLFTFLLSGIPTVENKNDHLWTDVRHDSCRLYASDDGVENKKHAR